MSKSHLPVRALPEMVKSSSCVSCPQDGGKVPAAPGFIDAQ